MKIMKVFDCQDWDGSFQNSNSNCKPFSILDEIQANDVWISWNIVEREYDVSYTGENNEYLMDEERLECKAAVEWINAQILKECPDLDPEEDVLIKVWW